jgi:hypothetical protein
LFDDELILRAHRAGLRLREIPVAAREMRPSRRGIAMLALRALVGLARLRLESTAESAEVNSAPPAVRRGPLTLPPLAATITPDTPSSHLDTIQRRRLAEQGSKELR